MRRVCVSVCVCVRCECVCEWDLVGSCGRVGVQNQVEGRSEREGEREEK
jgi:hypothetical protein